jgi:glutamate racemase
VLDSGVGGLSVLREIHHLLPNTPTIYVADQAHLPYGPRPAHEIRRFVELITRFLVAEGAELIVVGCNAASAASLLYMREQFPNLPFVGMEPAVKPAAEHTRSGVVGVLTTRTTAQGSLYQSVLERFAREVRVITQVAPELVRIAEENSAHTEASQQIIHGYLQPMLAEGADEIVLGCTHFPFLADVIQEIAGPGVQLIDPAPAVARQAARLWKSDLSEQPHRYYTTGEPTRFHFMLHTLLGISAPVTALRWEQDLSLTVPHS